MATVIGRPDAASRRHFTDAGIVQHEHSLAPPIPRSRQVQYVARHPAPNIRSENSRRQSWLANHGMVCCPCACDRAAVLTSEETADASHRNCLAPKRPASPASAMTCESPSGPDGPFIHANSGRRFGCRRTTGRFFSHASSPQTCPACLTIRYTSTVEYTIW